MMSSVAAVLLVFALLGGLLFLLRRVNNQRTSGTALGVVEAVSLGNGRALTLVRSGERYFLLGATHQSISLIAELESSEVATEEDSPAGAAGRTRLRELLARTRSMAG